MKIDVSSILNHPGVTTTFDLEGRLESPAEEIGLPEKVGAKGVATSAGDSVYVEGESRGVVALVCSRCLSPFRQSFKVPFEGRFVPVALIERWEDDEVELYPLDGGVCDLSPMLLQEIMISLPMQALCSPNCKGLCPVCGHNLNEGPCGCPEDEQELTPFGKKLMNALAERSKKNGRT